MYGVVGEVHKCQGVGDREERDGVERIGNVGKNGCKLQQKLWTKCQSVT